MGVLFHFVFSLFKIIVHAYIYSFITILLFEYLSRKNSNNWFSKVLKDFPKFKIICRFIYSVGLFIFMFTHWGDRGLGDISRIPLSYGREIGNIDGTNTFIPNTNNRRSDINIEKFVITEDVVCGEVIGDTIDYKGKYFVFDIKTNDVGFFKDRIKFDKYAIENKLPTADKFNDFFYHYSKYWNTWRLLVFV